jgi:esterase/lipase superfamily enzyme
MFIFTNRNLQEDEEGFDQFGDLVNPKGPNELRVVEVTRDNGDWTVDILNENEVALSAKERERLGLAPDEPALPSHRAVLDTVDAMVSHKRNLVVFIHGYSNDMESVVERCQELRENYDLEVLAFSWPTDSGGGAVTRYKSDKMDAQASAGAVERTLAKLKALLKQLIDPESDLRITLFMHSMGAYLYENLMRMGDPSGHAYLFDNVVMVAPDCNTEDHAVWINKIKAAGRVFVCINERDRALRFSEDMHGREQLPRLGQHRYDLPKSRAHYIDFTDTKRVRSSHSYFEGRVLKNEDVKKFFKAAFNGEDAEETTDGYIPHYNYYRVKRFNRTLG